MEIKVPRLLTPAFFSQLSTNLSNPTDTDSILIHLNNVYGLDLSLFASLPPPSSLLPLIKSMQSSISLLQSTLIPTIAVIHNHCIGAAIDLILACDIRYAHPSALFSIKEIDLGITADLGTLQRIVRKVGNDSHVRELCLTGRVFGAMEALKLGLVSYVGEDVKEKARELAREIKGKGRKAVKGTKYHLNYALDHSIDDGLEHVAVWNAGMMEREEIAMRANAFMKMKFSTATGLTNHNLISAAEIYEIVRSGSIQIINESPLFILLSTRVPNFKESIDWNQVEASQIIAEYMHVLTPEELANENSVPKDVRCMIEFLKIGNEFKSISDK